MKYQEQRVYTGNPRQLFSVRESRLLGGKMDGVRVADIHNGGNLEVCVAVDRCMDIPEIRYRGRVLNYITPNGIVHPSYYNCFGEGWSEAFAGGRREVGHPHRVFGSAHVEPAGDLPRGEPGHPVLGGDPLQFVEREAEQPRLVGRYGGIFHRSSIRSWFSGVFLRADIPARPRGESRSVRSRRGIPPLR